MSYTGSYKHLEKLGRVLLVDDSAVMFVGSIRGWYGDCTGCASEILRYSGGLGKMSPDWSLNYVAGSMVRAITFGEN